jgi:hypothetical protein
MSISLRMGLSKDARFALIVVALARELLGFCPS